MARRRRKSHSSKSRRAYHTLLVVGACGLVALLLLGWWAWRNVFVTDPSRYPAMGIDVSHHNGKVDFHQVRQAGVKFVYLKATEGTSHDDPTFVPNCRGAREAGLLVGAYHYFRKHLSGKEQARHFLQVVQNQSLQLPLVVDVEEWYPDDDARLNAELDRLEAMLTQLEQSGHRVMLYANRHDWNHYLRYRFGNRELWLSSFFSPWVNAGIPHKLQQYTFYGSVQGISGDVDLNIFVGSQAEWQSWLAGD